MKVGIISDIHGYPERFKKAMEYIKDSDMVLCAGDMLYHGPRNPILEGYNPQELAKELSGLTIPMLTSRGNCDAEVDMMVLDAPLFTPCAIYDNSGVRFMVMHGHDVDDEKLEKIAQYYKIDVMVTGHTHIRKLEKKGATIFVNPGSISVPKGDGQPSIAVYEDGRITFINILTGEKIKA